MSNSLKRKILVLDDDKIQHLLLRKRMAILGFDIDLIFFEEVAPALKHIESSPPDVVISDINLNGMDGWTFLEFIKNLNFKGKFYFVSSSIFPGDRTRAAWDPYVTNFFEKPIQETDLIYILSF
jgi:two-component system, response regulator PdtaR